MTLSIDALTEKEKDALRLLLRGHDAKSSAQALGLSVHTVNERLREARRKLGTTSSREAARRLLAEEGETPESLGDKGLGDAPPPDRAADRSASATRRLAGFGRALPLVGVIAMSLMLAALLLPVSPVSVAPASLIETVTGAAPLTNTQTESAAAAAAEAFLGDIDAGRWAESYAVTSAEFRRLNTLAVWAEVSARVRPPLGAVMTRNITGNAFVPAPPAGYRLVTFRSAYANGTQQTESVSLTWEDGGWKVAGISFD